MENNSYNQPNQNSQQPQAVDNQFIQTPNNQQPPVNIQPVVPRPITPSQVSLTQEPQPVSNTQLDSQEKILSVEDTIQQQIPAVPIEEQAPLQLSVQAPMNKTTQFSTSTKVPLSISLVAINIAVSTLIALYVYLSIRYQNIILLLVFSIVYLVVLILSFGFAGKIKKNLSDAITPSQNRIMIAILAFSGLIGLLIYYLKLRKNKPFSSKIAVNTWIKCFLLTIILNFIAGVILYPLILKSYVDAISWRTENYSKVTQLYSSVGKDMESLKVDVSAGDKTSSLTDCQQLSNDLNSLNAVKKYPVVAIQAKISSALNLMYKGSNDCVSSLQQGDSELFSTSVQEMNNGSSDFYNLLKSI